jgi:aminoglycoside N3'-acetyltransferase
VVAHASLKSFGHVEGGATAVVQAFTTTFRNLVMPAFNWGEGSALVAPLAGEALEHNGVDDDFLSSLPEHPRPFDPSETPVHWAMGAVPQELHRLPGTRRSAHPLASWLAHGGDARRLVEGQPWHDPHAPLRRLDGGYVLLAGVGLTSCTALHLAEERAGRRSFVRWVVAADGSVRRAHVGGCSDGFGALWPRLVDLFRTERCANAELAAAPLEALIARAAQVFGAEPELGACQQFCVRCRDVRGGR